jgi:hypothetical protein
MKQPIESIDDRIPNPRLTVFIRMLFQHAFIFQFFSLQQVQPQDEITTINYTVSDSVLVRDKQQYNRVVMANINAETKLQNLTESRPVSVQTHSGRTKQIIDRLLSRTERSSVPRKYLHQPDPCHPDPVDFDAIVISQQNQYVTTAKDMDKIEQFLQTVKQTHEEKLRYDSTSPDLNANNFTWVLQGCSSHATTTGTHQRSFVEVYKEPMLRLLQQREQIVHEIPNTHRIVIGIGYHQTTLKCIKYHIQYHAFAPILSPKKAMTQHELKATDMNASTNEALSLEERFAFDFSKINASNEEVPTALIGTLQICNNPFSYHKFRQTDQCIMVLTLMVVPKLATDDHMNAHNMDTTTILPSQDHGVPFMKFSSDLLESLLFNHAKDR